MEFSKKLRAFQPIRRWLLPDDESFSLESCPIIRPRGFDGWRGTMLPSFTFKSLHTSTMNPEHEEILIELNHKQLTGLCCLVFLAIREKTTIEHQWEEWGFDDIPHQIILDCEMDDAGLLELATTAATYLLEDLTILEKAIA